MHFNDRPFEDGEVPSNGEDLDSNDKMSKDSNYDYNGGSGGGTSGHPWCLYILQKI